MGIAVTALKQEDITLVVVTDYIGCTELQFAARNFSLKTSKVLCVFERADVSDITNNALMSAINITARHNEQPTSIKIACVFENHVSRAVDLRYFKSISRREDTIEYEVFDSLGNATTWLGTNLFRLDDGLGHLCESFACTTQQTILPRLTTA
jgi:hypothetical protein